MERYNTVEWNKSIHKTGSNLTNSFGWEKIE